ncbi:allergin-1 isoform X3 [Anolis carolinensis]|uniref:allergin-1 isoform X3 n=1 Tax=Anolis carolinensis TaxID=28377 RepID=UPI002F2B1592
MKKNTQVHSCLQNMQSHDGEKGTSEIAISCLKDLQDLEIYSPFSEIAIGKNVTLECRSQKGCLPINYTLYLNTTKMQHTIQRKAEEKVVFNITINSISDVGEYKCKAQNNGSKYSPGFTFTLRDEPKDVLSCSDPVNKVEISSPVSEIVLGGNVTLECKSVARCLPIYYSLFLNKDKALYNAIKSEEEKIVFNFTITSISQLGDYKCKAQSRQNDSSTNKYSHAFKFVLKAPEEEKNKLIVYIIAPLLLLFLLTVIAVAIPLIILPWCKAKNQKSARTSTHFTPVGYFNSETATYDAVGKVGTIYSFVIKSDGKGEEVVYCNVKTETMERECRKGTLKEDSTVNYAEIVIRR